MEDKNLEIVYEDNVVSNDENIVECMLQKLLYLYSKDDFNAISDMLNIGRFALKVELPINKYEDRMIFLPNNNRCIIVRVHVNANTEWRVDTLLITTCNIIDEKSLMDLIIKRWVGLNLNGRIDIKKYRNEGFNENFKYIHVKVGEESWNNLLRRCKNHGILVRDGFELAVESFLKCENFV